MTDPKSDYMFLHPETLEVAGLRLKPMTVATWNLLNRIGIKLDEESVDQATQARNVAALAWIQSAPKEEVVKTIHAGKADEAIDLFMFNIPLSQLNELMGEINRISEAVAASSFSVEAKPGDKEEQQPPN